MRVAEIGLEADLVMPRAGHPAGSGSGRPRRSARMTSSIRSCAYDGLEVTRHRGSRIDRDASPAARRLLDQRRHRHHPRVAPLSSEHPRCRGSLAIGESTGEWRRGDALQAYGSWDVPDWHDTPVSESCQRVESGVIRTLICALRSRACGDGRMRRTPRRRRRRAATVLGEELLRIRFAGCRSSSRRRPPAGLEVAPVRRRRP